MIRITCKQHNFRRCRVAHPKGTTDYPDDTFTPEQIKVLQAEPKLIVEIVPDEPEGTETETGQGTGESERGKVKIGEMPIVLAARQAITSGRVTKDGRPTVEALEEILGHDVSAEERDEAWEKISADYAD